MRAALVAIAGLFMALMSLALVADNPQGTPAASGRLVGVLVVGAVVDLSFRGGSGGLCEVVVLSEKELHDRVQRAKELTANLEEAKSESDDDDVARKQTRERIERGLRGISTPWTVVEVGENYARFEPAVRLPFREETSWIAIPEWSIKFIKSMN